MPKIVISDTSTLIVLDKINRLEILKALYSKLITTPEIALEYGQELPKWIVIESVSNKKYQRLLETQIDAGEASAIALAAEYNDASLLLLDDLKARKLAKQLGLSYTGTLGIITKAKKKQIIDSVKPVLD